MMKTLKFKEDELTIDLISKDRKFNDECLTAIKFGLENDLIVVPVLIIETENRNFELKYHREQWNKVLTKCMDYYISVEEYEICSEIKKLLAI